MKKNCIYSTNQSDYKNHSYSFVFLLMFKWGKRKVFKIENKAEKKKKPFWEQKGFNDCLY